MCVLCPGEGISKVISEICGLNQNHTQSSHRISRENGKSRR